LKIVFSLKNSHGQILIINKQGFAYSISPAPPGPAIKPPESALDRPDAGLRQIDIDYLAETVSTITRTYLTETGVLS
jgi:hypothetical protein